MTACIGFISVRRHPEHGYFGGYLITNANARPLEFHCTMPVKPSRAQELLYGATIEDFVCGEQIAKALTIKAKLRPPLVLTDAAAVLAITLVSDMSAAVLQMGPREGRPHFALPGGNPGPLRELQVESWKLLLPSASTVDDDVARVFAELAPNFDLTEPFQRIEDALLEAHPSAKAA